jgi:hypothetical protein
MTLLEWVLTTAIGTALGIAGCISLDRLLNRRR